MNIVSFKVARTLKEVGYPQYGSCDEYYNQEGRVIDKFCDINKLIYPAPTYLDVWLWLWRTRGFYIDIAHYYNSNEVTIWDNKYNKIKSIECMGNSDPEEVIEKAIEYLVTKTNDLIK